MSSIHTDDINEDLKKFKNEQKRDFFIVGIFFPFTIVYGGYGVGKSTFIMRFIKNIFVKDHDPTIEDIYQKQFQVDNLLYNIQILDIIGNEEINYDNLRRQYNKQANVFLLLFDLTRLESLESLETDIQQISIDTDDQIKCKMILVGTKCDLIQEKDIDYEKITIFIQKHSLPFIKTSSKDSINVNETFLLAINQTPSIQSTSNINSKNSNCIIM